jgi:ribonucleoside-triphosphate reductase
MSVLTTQFLNSYRTRSVNWGFPSGPNYLGELVYRRTYRRGSENWRDTVARVVEGAFDVLERHCRENGRYFEQENARVFAEAMYEAIFSFDFLPPGRGLWLMGTEFVREKGGAGLNNCFVGNTEIVTRHGVQRIADCDGTSQDVWTKDGWVTAPIRSFGRQSVQQVTFAPAHPGPRGVGWRTLRSNHRVVHTVTPNHRWLLTDGTVTDALKMGDTVPGLAVLPMTEPTPAYQDGFRHGLVFADGTKNNDHADGSSRYSVRLCGDKARYAELFEEVTRPDSYGGDPVGRLTSTTRLKELPPEGTKAEYLCGFLDGWVAGDGSDTPAGSVQLSSQHPRAASWLRRHAATAGWVLRGLNEDSTTNTNFGPRSAPLVKFTLTKQRCAWKVVGIERLPEEEEVFCATVPGVGAFTLASGVYTMNCAFISTQYIATEYSMPFRFLMDMSMLGVGVGFDTRGAGTCAWKPSREVAPYWDITDDREGWVESTGRIIDWGLGRGPRPRFRYHLIRKAGEPIKGFGGTASGPGALIDLHEALFTLIERRAGQPVSSRDITDVGNLIGVCVVAGNVRRTAEIVFGEASDLEYLDLKNYECFPERAAWGWTSNNSVFARVGMDYGPCAERTARNGEPGYAWLENMRAYGRMMDGANWLDWRAMGGNPCLEQTLEHGELCTLVENFPARHRDLAAFKRTLGLSWLYAKIVTLVPTHWELTNKVMRRNRRVGSSMSGIVQVLDRLGQKEFARWCDEGYQHLCRVDRDVSRWLAVNESLKKSSVKPSGTVSLLVGATPGCHWPTMTCYIRRVRYAADHPDVGPLRAAGYKVEPAIVGYEDFAAKTGPIYDPRTVVVEFPVRLEGDLPSEQEVPLAKKVELAVLLQHVWADNQVSCTASFRPEEGKQIRPLLAANDHRLKGISFLPLREDQVFPQMPYEAITTHEYEQRVAGLRPILWDAGDTHAETERFCDGGACELQTAA